MAIPDQEYDFMKFYMEQSWEEMRHLEQLRATVSSLVITLATLIVGFIVQQGFAQSTAIMSMFVMVLGIFGAVMVRKLYQVHQFDQERLNRWYEYFQEMNPDAQVLKRRDMADPVNRKKFWALSRIPHNYFWFGLHACISVVGLILLLLTLI
jgi:hypothetical protein